MATNQIRSGSLLEAKTVPARTDVCLRQELHWNSLRVPRLTVQCDLPPQSGHSKPFGQRHLTSAVWHCSSLPYALLNSRSLRPF